MSHKSIGFRVRGRVQGVWFRASTRREAEALGLRGWVRNEPDGSVSGVAQGEDAAVDALVAWLHRGPSGARVDAVEVAAIEAAAHEDFRVER